MKTFMTTALTIVVLAMTACAGSQARQTILTPALQQALVSIEAQALAGGATEAQVEALSDALESGDRVGAAAAWPAVRAAAEADIESRLQSGVIGPGVAESHRERLRNFEEGVIALGRRYIQ